MGHTQWYSGLDPTSIPKDCSWRVLGDHLQCWGSDPDQLLSFKHLNLLWSVSLAGHVLGIFLVGLFLATTSNAEGSWVSLVQGSTLALELSSVLTASF